MGEVIHMGAYLRRLHSDIEELQYLTDDEVIIYMLRPEEDNG
jgi:hypothetical protein